MPLDDIIAVRVDQGKLGIFKLLLRKDPFLLQLREGQHAQQDGFARFIAFRIMQRNEIAEGQGLFPVDGVCVGAGNVDGLADVMNPAHIV